MTQDHLAFILEAHAAKPDKDGWATVTDNRMLTLYVAHDGVPLTVPRVEAIQSKGGVLRARTQKGETFFLALEDLFGASTEAPPTQGRKAGFV